MARYKQGDIVVVNFPFTDISQTKRRPALVVSNDEVNETGDYLLVQITSQYRQDALTLPLSIEDYSSQPLPLVSYIRKHKLFLLNESLITSKVSSVTPKFHQKLVNAIHLILAGETNV
ncbi:MAG: type II toxin-antitoxin system PemK/MazF family toxin [Bacteroidetes bacterium]|nr:type II toxin-antitoxin system PemK/MazF family toxin [Bacteroidota bacterium]